jgi:hypothetical protein
MNSAFVSPVSQISRVRCGIFLESPQPHPRDEDFARVARRISKQRSIAGKYCCESLRIVFDLCASLKPWPEEISTGF